MNTINGKQDIDPAFFRVRRARHEDVPALAALEVSAFLDSPMHKAMFPERLRIKPGVQDQVEWNMTRMRRGLADPSLAFLVVAYRRPGQGEIIVGGAEWSVPTQQQQNGADEGETGESERQDKEDKKDKEDEVVEREVKEEREEIERKLNGLPPCLDKGVAIEAATEVKELLERSKAAFRGKRRDKTWTLNSISVDGDYRGLGIGKMLTRWGMDRAEQDEADIWVVSSPPGKPLYDGLGFRLVAEGSRLGEPQYVMLKSYDGPE